MKDDILEKDENMTDEEVELEETVLETMEGGETEEVEEEKDPNLTIVEFIREASARVKLTKKEDLTKEPISLEEEIVDEKINLLTTAEAYSDIVAIKGSKTTYLYSSTFISNSYANILVRVEDGNLYELIANTVRQDSKVYPRPTDSEVFLQNPFNLSGENLKQLIEQMKGMEMYKDINHFITTTKAMYLYSSDHIASLHAKRLAEDYELDKYEPS